MSLKKYQPGFSPTSEHNRPKAPEHPSACCIKGCKRPFFAVARRVWPLCNAHYQRFRGTRFKVPVGSTIDELLEGPSRIKVPHRRKDEGRLTRYSEAANDQLALDKGLRKAIAKAKLPPPPSWPDPIFAPPVSYNDQILNRLEAVVVAYDHLITFTKLMMPHPDAAGDVRFSLYEPALHHRAIAAALEEVEKGTITKLIIVAPPRHGKTELTSKKLVAWYAGRHPAHHVIFGTYNENYAKDVGRSVRETVLSPAFGQVFPDFALKDYSQAAERFETMAGGVFAFVGRGGTTTGRGGHLLVVDDPIKNRKEANSQIIREDAWTWFTQVVRTRMMTDRARIIIIMTRWSEDDIVGRLIDPTNEHFNPEEARTWKIIDLPAIAVSEHDPLGRTVGEALWPERFGVQFLDDQMRSDPLGFSALYQGRPTPPGGAFFQESFLRTYRSHDLPKNLRYYCGSDHAVATVQQSDKTCLIPVGVDENDNIYVLRDVVWRKMPTDVAVEAMLDIMRRLKPLFWWAEKGHITQSIGPFLRKRMNEQRTYSSFIELTPTKDKETRAQSIMARASQGKVYFPIDAPWWADAKIQLLKFPNAAHDDFVDAMSMVGMGLSLMTSTSTGQTKQKSADGTFAALLEESNQRRLSTAIQRATGGW